MQQDFNTHRDILELWRKDSQGAFPLKQVAAALGVSKTCIAQWRARYSIPVRYWPRVKEVVEAEFKKELSFDALTYMAIRGEEIRGRSE